jgi:hypothetical protein
MAYPVVALISHWTDTSDVSFDWMLMAVPTLLLISLVGTIAGSLLTKPEDPLVLLDFYKRTRPWGWWGPIRELAMERDPGFKPNRDFGLDLFNVAIGVIWQTSFVALPIYAVIRHWHEAIVCLAIIAFTSLILKRTWYDRLEPA